MTAADFSRTLRLASLALGYPDQKWRAQLPLVTVVTNALTAPARQPMRRFLDAVAVMDPTVLEQAFTETFDLRRRCCPYLTYYSHGDTRKRGIALLTFTAAYRAAGFGSAGAAGFGLVGELPDHVAVLCEFTAAAPEPGLILFRRHRAGLELLRQALTDADSPWRHVIDAIRAVLPEPAPRDLDRALELARTGPPAEQVGLEPFAPPEYMGGRT